MARRKKRVWYARGGGIAKAGPFKSAEEAAKAIRLKEPEKPNPVSVAFRTLFNAIAAERPRLALVPLSIPEEKPFDPYPPDAFIWPEEV